MSNLLLGGIFGLQSLGSLKEIIKKSTYLLTISCNEQNELYKATLEYISDMKEWRRTTKSISLETNKDKKILSVPGYGLSEFVYNNITITIDRTNEHQGAKNGELLVFSVENSENMKQVENLVKASMVYFIEKYKNFIKIFTPTGYTWEVAKFTTKRTLESMVLTDEQFKLIKDVENFFKKETQTLYEKLSVPWRRGYALYGSPGQGKSSFVASLASHIGLDLYFINLANPDIDDNKLRRLMLNIPTNNIILFEDIDSIRATHNRWDDDDDENIKSQITLSGLLNCIDSSTAQEGCALFMTTNRIEVLDPALLRPGRVDYQIEFLPPGRKEIGDMYIKFFSDSPLFGNQQLINAFYDPFLKNLSLNLTNGSVISFAQLQGIFLKARISLNEHNVESTLLEIKNEIESTIKENTRKFLDQQKKEQKKVEGSIDEGKEHN
eukprot:TRINITY_DN3111_c0_g1_i1.p1 TRINITY_DN3111_c0_g1~~TRINITY_DN3111_c0_g1_i1.p1  ORF type:complete len:438 (+),score=78.12 TRINITY_DN3111_c0_g1_i1:103-1416(+)